MESHKDMFHDGNDGSSGKSETNLPSIYHRQTDLQDLNTGKFEIGLVYLRPYSRLPKKIFLAITPTLAMNGIKGKIHYSEYSNSKKFRLIKGDGGSVADICRNWGITVETLDSVTRPYFTPDYGAREDAASRNGLRYGEGKYGYTKEVQLFDRLVQTVMAYTPDDDFRYFGYRGPDR